MTDKSSSTLQYYNDSAVQFSETTKDIEFKDTQERFLKYLATGGRILDFGCGSGRDTKYFSSRGYQVDAVDGSEELVKIAWRKRQNLKLPALSLPFPIVRCFLHF